MATALIVDDSKMDQRLAGRLLENQDGLSVVYADDGERALEQIAKEAPDLVVTDLQMPGMDGLELVKAIRHDYPNIPVVLMTAAGSEEVAAEALRRGAASYVPKRYLSRDLAPTVDRILIMAATAQEQDKVLECLTHAESMFVLDNDISRIQPVIAWFRHELIRAGMFDENEQMRIAVALDEAISNAIHHGNLEISSDMRQESTELYFAMIGARQNERPYSDRRVRVTSKLTRAQVVFEIEDEGPGFTPDEVPDPTLPENLEKASGRGLLLIRTFMDEVYHNESGNVITMVRRRSNGTSTESSD